MQEARSGKKESKAVEKGERKTGDMKYACVMAKEQMLTQQVEQHNVWSCDACMCVWSCDVVMGCMCVCVLCCCV